MSTLGLDPWWVAALAPTVVDTRDAAPRRSITGVCEPWHAEAGAGEERARGLVRRPWSRWCVIA